MEKDTRFQTVCKRSAGLGVEEKKISVVASQRRPFSVLGAHRLSPGASPALHRASLMWRLMNLWMKICVHGQGLPARPLLMFCQVLI